MQILIVYAGCGTGIKTGNIVAPYREYKGTANAEEVEAIGKRRHAEKIAGKVQETHTKTSSWRAPQNKDSIQPQRNEEIKNHHRLPGHGRRPKFRNLSLFCPV
jgi:hypothetical protein